MVNNNIVRNIEHVKDLKKIIVFKPNDTIHFDAADVADFNYDEDRRILQILKTNGDLNVYCNIPFEVCFENQESLDE